MTIASNYNEAYITELGEQLQMLTKINKTSQDLLEKQDDLLDKQDDIIDKLNDIKEKL